MSDDLHIKNYLPEPRKFYESTNGQSNQSSKISTKLLDERVKYLFQQFLTIYDDKWSDKISTPELFNEKLKLWASATKNLTNEQMRKGLNQATIKCAWPPSISEFLEFAQEQIYAERTHHDAYKEYQRALPTPRDRELARKAIRELRFKVGLMK